MALEKVFNNRILLADLTTGKCEERELGDKLAREQLGGAALNLELLRRFPEGEPLVIGTGLLTSTFCPGAGVGVVTAKSPRSGLVVHHPFIGMIGIELKLSGFDFIVVRGRSEKPVRLWLHDELAEVSPAGEVKELGTNQVTGRIRDEYGDMNIHAFQVGPAGAAGSPLAMISESCFGGYDRAGLGLALAEKGLYALVVRGLGNLEVADGFFPESAKLMQETAQSLKGKTGIKEILRLWAKEDSFLPALEKVTHRHSACYSCPFPCRTFGFLREDPARKLETDASNPGCLLIDPQGVLALSFLGNDYPHVYEHCTHLGVDPAAVGLMLKAEGIGDKEAADKWIEALVKEKKDLINSNQNNFHGVTPWPDGGDLSAALVQAAGVFSNGIPPAVLPLSTPPFSLPSDPVEKAALVLERTALGLILGVCPLLLLSTPVITPARLATLVKLATEWDGIGEEELKAKAKSLIGQTLKLAAPREAISEGLKPAGFDAAWAGLKKRYVEG
jgi:aldehyde:ferredoxin oxidoreductase